MAVCLISLSSCEKEHFVIRYGFNSEISGNSSGLVLISLGHNDHFISLNGYISVNSGEVEVILVNPDGAEVFSRKIKSPTRIYVTEVISAEPGIWKLKYRSVSGIGLINLHATF